MLYAGGLRIREQILQQDVVMVICRGAVETCSKALRAQSGARRSAEGTCESDMDCSQSLTAAPYMRALLLTQCCRVH